MINRIFFVTEDLKLFETQLSEEENVFYTLLVNPLDKSKLLETYDFCIVHPQTSIGLTLTIEEELSIETIRQLTSFLFLASYLRIDNTLILNLTGNKPSTFSKAESALREYWILQGIDNIAVNVFPTAPDVKRNYRLTYSFEDAAQSYQELLNNNETGMGTLLIPISGNNNIADLLSSLKEKDVTFRKEFPQLYELIEKYRLLEKEASYLRRKISYNEKELDHQKQYLEILRSQHSTRELQDYYDREYEVLPSWYKRIGHILKVIMGKRTFKSLFSDNVKKYKD